MEDINKDLNDWKDKMCGRMLYRTEDGYNCITPKGSELHNGKGCKGCPYEQKGVNNGTSNISMQRLYKTVYVDMLSRNQNDKPHGNDMSMGLFKCS